MKQMSYPDSAAALVKQGNFRPETKILSQDFSFQSELPNRRRGVAAHVHSTAMPSPATRPESSDRPLDLEEEDERMSRDGSASRARSSIRDKKEESPRAGSNSSPRRRTGMKGPSLVYVSPQVILCRIFTIIGRASIL